MKINQQRMAAEFAALVAIDSPSYGEKHMGEYIKQTLKAFGFSISEDRAGAGYPDGCGNIYGYLEGTALGEPLLFCAHMDTVEPSRGKRAVFGKNGIITSGGDTVLGADDCSGIASILEALRVIQENKLPHRPIEVLFTIAEEVYCDGAARFDFSTLQAKEAYVLDLAGPVGTAAYKAPSILFFKATVNGKSAHAGFEPQNGVHAIAAAANAVSQLAMGHLDGETTLNIGLIEGGRATNIVPDQCVARGEVRSFSHKKAGEQVDRVRRQFIASAGAVSATVDFEAQCGCRAYETPLAHPVVRRFERACAIARLTPVLEPTFGGSDNNHLAKHGIAGLVMASGMYRCHSREEYTTVEELLRSAALTVSLMTLGKDGGAG